MASSKPKKPALTPDEFAAQYHAASKRPQAAQEATTLDRVAV